MSRCGYIVPLNLYPKTHILRKMLILQPRNNQVQHIVVKVMGERGEMTYNRSRESLSQVRSISLYKQSIVLMHRYGREMEALAHLRVHV
jgi:hypothetical protein